MDWIGLESAFTSSLWIGFRKLDPRPTLIYTTF